MFKAVLICLIVIPCVAAHGQRYSAPNRELASFSNVPSTSGDPQALFGGSARFQSSTGSGLTHHVFEPNKSQQFGRGFDLATGFTSTGRNRSQKKFGRGHFEVDEDIGNRGIFQTSSRPGRTGRFDGSFGIERSGRRGGVGGSLRSLSRTSASTSAGISSSARILRQERQESQDGSYAAFFETEDGITWEEQGAPLGPEGAIVKKGSYTFTFPDGTPGQVRYIADENGFRPESDLIPAAPAHALAQLKKAQEERSFGAVDDGQYRSEDHHSSNGLRDIPLLNGNRRVLSDSRAFGGSFHNQFEANSGFGLRNNQFPNSRIHQRTNFGGGTPQNTVVIGFEGSTNDKYTHV